MNQVREMCVHDMNPVSCPICYKIKPPEAKKVETLPHRAGVPTGHVIPIGEATMRATMRHATTGAPQVEGKEFKAPYSEAAMMPPSEAHSKDKLWKPSGHKQLIDSLPRHPHANATATPIKV